MNTTGSSSSAQICSTQLLDTSIEDARNKKKTIVSTLESVIRLMREVECEEKAAEQAKDEAALSCLDIRVKLDEYKQARRYVEETNDMLAKEASVQKDILATKMEVLQLHMENLLDNGNRSLELLDEMHRTLEERLNSALVKKESANKKKREIEAFARASLTYEVIWMEKLEEESKRLKQEAVEISKLQELLIDRGHVVDMLHLEMYDKCQDVKLLKKELDQAILPDGIMSYKQTSSILASSSSSLGSVVIPFKPKPEPADFDVPLKKRRSFVLIDSTDDHVQSANHKRIIRVRKRPLICEDEDFESSDIKGDYFGKDTRDVATKANKLHGNQMFARSFKKGKIKGKLHDNRTVAKTINKVKIKCRLSRNKMFAKSIKKGKLKGKLHGTQLVARSIKKVKIKGRLHINRTFAESIKKAKIKGKLHGNQMIAKTIKKLKIKDEVRGTQIFATRVKKVKVKGLSAVSKRREAADHKR